MKRILSAVMLLALGMGAALAQSTASTTQVGNSNEALATQTGSNTSTIQQTGDFQKATVGQTGANTASVTQSAISPGAANKGNEATVNQDGQGNGASVTQDRSGGQQNKITKATVGQTGDNNGATVVQDGYYQGSNTSSVTQNGLTGGAGNTASVHQMGYGNNWTITQTGDLNTARQEGTSVVHSGTTNKITQDGLSNTAYQYTGGSDAMKATINQITGVVGNYAEQRQSGLKAQAVINQYSSSNQAYQEQYRGSYKHDGVYAVQHQATITQTGGTGNYARQYQTENVADVWANSRNTSAISQDGISNSSTVLQNDGLNKGDVLQAGNDNVGNITQHTQENLSDITQTGNNNTANVIQQTGNGNVLGKAGEPLAKGLEQVGDGNTFTLTQSGAGNIVSQFRPLKNVYASVKQAGDGNSMAIVQTGDNHVVGQAAYPYYGNDQIGNYNMANLDQVGGNGNTVSYFYQRNNYNAADLDQVGNGNRIAAAGQVGLSGTNTYNALTILQQGDNNNVTGAHEEGLNIIGVIEQVGDQNKAGLQLSRTDARGEIYQTGNLNDGAITINKSYIGNANTGFIDQNGNSNKATQYVGQTDPAMVSSSNSMSAVQTGDSNVSTIWVQGSTNQASSMQTGTGNTSAISQLGNGNVATVTQK